MKETYGNCAVIAWLDEFVLGHLVFLPKGEARTAGAVGREFFGLPELDDGVLVVINLAFCSLSGHSFRRKGIGKAMVHLMRVWAKSKNWKRIEVFRTSGGLFPWDWFDACIPPKPFWETVGFQMMNFHPHSYTEADLAEIMADNPRNSLQEQKQKQLIIEKIRKGLIPESETGFFDLKLDL